MDSDDLTTRQAKQINDRLSPMLRYIGNLRSRMERRGFPNDDRLFREVQKAHDALHALWVHTHYLSCQTGVGSPRRK